MNIALQERVAELENVNNQLISDLNDTDAEVQERSTSSDCTEILEMIKSGFNHTLRPVAT